MPLVARNCPHIVGQDNFGIVEAVLANKDRFSRCNDCEAQGRNLWICLYPECLYVGCPETDGDHSTIHSERFPSHSIHINLSMDLIWCYACSREVIIRHVPSPPSTPNHSEMNRKYFNGPVGDSAMDQHSRDMMDQMQTRLLNDAISTLEKMTEGQEASSSNEHLNRVVMGQVLAEKSRKYRLHLERGDTFQEKSYDSQDSSDSDDSKELSGKPGLVGLQNIGNTCYMNAALQALSNVPPLTQFFLTCPHIVNYISKDRKPGLSMSYLSIINDMWNKKTRGYVAPHSILAGIRTVYSLFRGYQQHDTQEFLRCFMDQLHEELKEQVEEAQESVCRSKSFGDHSSDDEEMGVDGTGSSQSDAEYLTCAEDSGMSSLEQSELDELCPANEEDERGTKRRYSKVLQSDKTRSKSMNRGFKKSNSQQEVSYSQLEKSMQQRSLQNSPTKHRAKRQMKTRSIISDIFDGKLLSSVQCLTCDRISTRVETFQDLSLPIPSRDHVDMLHQSSLTPQKTGPCSDVVYANNQSGWFAWLMQWLRSWIWGPVVSLHDCLSAFFSADELKGDNMYSCEKCKKLRNGIKFSKVLELPEILCVHLKRFRHELMFSSKIANYVSFPLEGLDMRPYLLKEGVSQVTTYDLISVICHHGTAGAGHYTCYAYNPYAKQWFEFDDQCVTKVSSETVKVCEAYVLFYRKCSPETARHREKFEELMELSIGEPNTYFVSLQWINRFKTFAEPGPIDNTDFLCPHKGVNPARSQLVNKLCIPVRKSVWDYLHKNFGGGPVCTNIYECAICEEKYKYLMNRRQNEYEFVQKLQHGAENPTAIYALAVSWRKQWQSFVRGKEMQPPGPIDNSSIVTNKNGQTLLQSGSDYDQISEDLWQFFHGTYGGGPELLLQACPRLVQPCVHSPLNSSVTDSNRVNRSEPKANKIGNSKYVETSSQQDSAVESITTDSDSYQTLRD